MAIKRCPYCRAIIDEGLEFCSNCGTQLLFPEDEFIEEDIPGEKIIDVNDEEEAAPPAKKARSASKPKESSKTRAKKAASGKDPAEKETSSAPKKKVEDEPESDQAADPDAQPEEEEADPILPDEEDFEDEFEDAGDSIPEDEHLEEMDMSPPDDDEADFGLDEEDPERHPLDGTESSGDEKPDEDSDFEVEPLEDEDSEPEATDSEPVDKSDTDLGEGWTFEEVRSDKDKETSGSQKFRTKDLEKIFDSEEREKLEIERFLESLKKDRGLPDVEKTGGKKGQAEPSTPQLSFPDLEEDETPPETPDADFPVESPLTSDFEAVQKKIDASFEEPDEPFEPQEEEEPEIEAEDEEPETGAGELRSEPEESEFELDKIPDTGELPPWASRIQRDTSPDDDLSEESGTEDEFEPIEDSEDLPPPKVDKPATVETGMGIPETVGQAVLPVPTEVHEEELEAVRPTAQIAYWLKSRIFDVAFIVLLWLGSLFVASRLLEISLFPLLTTTALPALGYLAVLLLIYFFLFLYFLGETIGDQIFPAED